MASPVRIFRKNDASWRTRRKRSCLDHRAWSFWSSYQSGFRNDVKVALYVQARARDLAGTRAGRHDTFWLVTNAKFTEDASQYGACAGLKLLGWDHPTGQGLERRLERHQLLPVTGLSTLNRSEKNRLLQRGVVLATELTPELLREVGSRASTDRVFAEIDEVTAEPSEVR